MKHIQTEDMFRIGNKVMMIYVWNQGCSSMHGMWKVETWFKSPIRAMLLVKMNVDKV